MGALLRHRPAVVLPQRFPLYSPVLYERRRELVGPRHAITIARPIEAARVLRVSDGEFERFLEALSYGDPIAMSGLTRAIRGRRSFIAYSETFTSAHSGTITAPALSGHATLTSDGAGGGGDLGTSSPTVRGGGGSGRCVNTAIAVTPGDALNYSVPDGGVGRTSTTGSGVAGSATTTSSGAGAFTGIAHNAGGGGGATTAANGAAGVASGGATNTNGNAGTNTTSGKGGNSAAGAVGGANTDGAGSGGQIGGTPGGGGGGGDTLDSTNGADGGPGRFQVDWAA